MSHRSSSSSSCVKATFSAVQLLLRLWEGRKETQKSRNNMGEGTNQKGWEKAVLQRCWESPIIMWAMLSATLLLLKHNFTEHLSYKVMTWQKEHSWKGGPWDNWIFHNLTIYSVICNKWVPMWEQSTLFLAIICLIISLPALCRPHECYSTHSMKQVWYPYSS